MNVIIKATVQMFYSSNVIKWPKSYRWRHLKIHKLKGISVHFKYVVVDSSRWAKKKHMSWRNLWVN